MPCSSGGYDDYGLGKMNSELTRYTRGFCEMVEYIQKNDLVLFNKMIDENKFLNDLYEDHVKDDHDRWYKFYKAKHPTFTKKEIVKMVIAGVLERV